MKGLRTKENFKFLRFWKIVQGSANAMGKIFFLDCGEGNCFEDDNIECENLTGWLIDIDKSNEFEVIFKSFSNIDDVWNDYLAFVAWHKNDDNNISVTFEWL